MNRRSPALVPIWLRSMQLSAMPATLSDQRAGVLGQSEIAVSAAEDRDLERDGEWGSAFSRSPHHTPSVPGTRNF
jgi:hypothetical protein